MLMNYMKIAWRNLVRNRLPSAINLFGLTAGTVCCLTIMVYVNEQTGYDAHHRDANSLYKIVTFIDGASIGSDDINSATSSPPIAFALKEDFPEVAEACRLIKMDGFNVDLLKWSESKEGYYEKGGYIADSTIFKVFNFKFIEGDGLSALYEPNTMVLSASLAKKLFGRTSALDKMIEISGSGGVPNRFLVTGVYDENYGKSHLRPNYILSMNSPGLGTFIRSVDNFATQNFVHSYIRLIPGANADLLEDKLPAFLMAHGQHQLAETGMDKKLSLQKVKDIHLYSTGISNQVEMVSSIRYLYFLLTLAVFIQLVACINFINLSTAKAGKRSREIGIRKVIGADRISLVYQFMGESFVLALLAILISIPMVLLLLPFVNDLTQGNIDFRDVLDVRILALLFPLGLLTGFFSGLYPAIMLSDIKPIRALRGTFNATSAKGNLRKGLVIFQFIISIGLITSVIVITEQYQFTQNKDLGFNKKNLIGIRLNTREAIDNSEALKTELSTLSGIQHIAESDYAPSENILTDMGLYRPGGNPENRTLVKINGVKEGYFSTMEIPLKAGRDLNDSDTDEIIVNESFLRTFQIDADKALGSRFLNNNEDKIQELKIVGVVGDYHYSSLKEAIQPMMLYRSDNPHWLLLRMGNIPKEQLLPQMERIWREHVKNAPMDYNFIDQDVERFYGEEKRLGRIASLFTGLAILISCLGLFGLVSFIAEQKKKEIGIRKVLGAGIRSVLHLLTWDFIKLVCIAFVIASPLAYFAMDRWLQGFEYKIVISGWIFLVSGSAALIITLFTIGFQALNSALANPVKSLRTE